MNAGPRAPAPGDRQATTHLLYLHGFRSGPQSTKARQMAAWVARHRPGLDWVCPQLPPSPAEALALIRQITAAWPAGCSAVMGSSLGGFYATVQAEALGCRAVLINPAVFPARDLAARVGESTLWHSGEAFHFQPHYVDELLAMAPGPLAQATRYLALIAEGDEVLDWREMVSRYAGAHLVVQPGGDHALSNFESHLPAIAQHLGW